MLCGKRYEYSYLNMTRVEKAGSWFNCPDDLIPCSTSTNLGGSTACARSVSECPITDLQILDKDSTSKILSDINYTKRETIDDGSGISLYLAFTVTNNQRSNAPLQSVRLTYGTPCAFSDDQDVVPTSQPQPAFYTLESITNLDSC